jgi:hypothetical protein
LSSLPPRRARALIHRSYFQDNGAHHYKRYVDNISDEVLEAARRAYARYDER